MYPSNQDNIPLLYISFASIAPDCKLLDSISSPKELKVSPGVLIDADTLPLMSVSGTNAGVLNRYYSQPQLLSIR